MSRDSGEKMRQEYLTNTSELEEKVRELQSALEQVRREVAEIARELELGIGEVKLVIDLFQC